MSNEWPRGSGEMAAAIRRHDWAATPLGDVEQWPARLRAAVDLMLPAGFPMIALWGPDLVQIYNDAYRALMGAKHPRGLGQPTAECWPEVWHINAPIYARVLQGETVTFEDALYPLVRADCVEDVWLTLTYSPLLGDDGEIAGVLVTIFETTERVRSQAALRESEEQHAFLLRFSDALRAEPDGDAVAARALRMLRDEMRLDRCYVGVYRLAEDRGEFPYQVHDAGLSPLPEAVRLSDFPEALRVAFDRTLVIDDIVEAESLSDTDRLSFEALGLRALIAATLRKGDDNPLWAIVAVSARPRRWTPSEITLVEQATERTWAAVERARAEAALRRSEARFRALVGATSDILYRMSPDWREMRRLDGRGFVADTDAPRRDWMDAYIVPEDRPLVQAAIAEAIAGDGPFDLEHRMRRSDGGVGWVRSRAVPVQDASGAVSEWFGAASDITERKSTERHQAMLMSELDHRVKNVLGLVQAIARQTLAKEGPDVADAAERFVGRLSALAKSHRLLAEGRWEGASLRTLVEDALAPQRGAEAGRAFVAGPDLKVAPKPAQTLALAFHELATNAVKYGAFSNDAGRVHVRWEVAGEGEDARLVFAWQESGGPRLSGPPSNRGFGSRLIEKTLEFELSGKVELDFAPQGLRASLDLPLGSVLAEGAPRPPEPQATPPTDDRVSLVGKRVLVVEDDHIVAGELAQVLEEAGAIVVGPVPNVDLALRAVESETVDAAVLDVNLRGRHVWPVAHALHERRVPLVFATGYSRSISPPPDLADITWLEKPVDPRQLASALAAQVSK